MKPLCETNFKVIHIFKVRKFLEIAAILAQNTHSTNILLSTNNMAAIFSTKRSRDAFEDELPVKKRRTLYFQPCDDVTGIPKDAVPDFQFLDHVLKFTRERVGISNAIHSFTAPDPMPDAAPSDAATVIYNPSSRASACSSDKEEVFEQLSYPRKAPVIDLAASSEEGNSVAAVEEEEYPEIATPVYLPQSDAESDSWENCSLSDNEDAPCPEYPETPVYIPACFSLTGAAAEEQDVIDLAQDSSEEEEERKCPTLYRSLAFYAPQ